MGLPQECEDFPNVTLFPVTEHFIAIFLVISSRSQTFISIRSFINIMLLSLEELFYFSKRIFYNILIKVKIFSFIGSSRLKNVFKNFHLIFNFIFFYKITTILLNKLQIKLITYINMI